MDWWLFRDVERSVSWVSVLSEGSWIMLCFLFVAFFHTRKKEWFLMMQVRFFFLYLLSSAHYHSCTSFGDFIWAIFKEKRKKSVPISRPRPHRLADVDVVEKEGIILRNAQCASIYSALFESFKRYSMIQSRRNTFLQQYSYENKRNRERDISGMLTPNHVLDIEKKILPIMGPTTEKANDYAVSRWSKS